LLKIFIYFDTAINFGFQEKWAMSGFFGMYSVVTSISFVAQRIFNAGVA